MNRLNIRKLIYIVSVIGAMAFTIWGGWTQIPINSSFDKNVCIVGTTIYSLVGIIGIICIIRVRPNKNQGAGNG